MKHFFGFLPTICSLVACLRAHKSRDLNRVSQVIISLVKSCDLLRVEIPFNGAKPPSVCFIWQTSRNDLKSFSWKLNVIPLYYVC